MSSPVVVGQRVLVGSYEGGLNALSTEDGSIVWRYDMPGWVTSSPLVWPGGIAFTDRAASAPGKFVVLRAA